MIENEKPFDQRYQRYQIMISIQYINIEQNEEGSCAQENSSNAELLAL